ncbi:MAG TPA: class I SAM-dependent methyltransferase [Gaiellaceae bacterium]|jgi:SAM-dependent methyltransferase|nr:class I SAM-dependent methyltransferase [Gaiellaceae bacterium]
MAFNDQAVVREQYATEANLQARKALWDGAEGDDPKEILWRTLEAWQPQRVLEVGGGEGELAERMHRELGAQVSFVDFSPRMVELARARGIDAQEGDVQQLPFADGAFDTVVAAWMLYHVPDLDAGLGEIARVLTKGGALVAVTNSVRHIEELRELLAYPPGAFEMTFNSENGQEHLERHFSSVERFDTVVTATVRERERLVAYRNSVSVPTQPVPENVELPFTVHGRTTIFVAMT